MRLHASWQSSKIAGHVTAVATSEELTSMLHVACGQLKQQCEQGGHLHAGFHDLTVVMNGPHAHHALLPATDDTGAVRGAADGCHSALMRIMDGVQQLAALRPKRTDLAIAPPTDDALPILQLMACPC